MGRPKGLVSLPMHCTTDWRMNILKKSKDDVRTLPVVPAQTGEYRTAGVLHRP
jgi:hypothetical protein